MKSGVDDRDMGYAQLLKSFEGLNENVDVLVGVPETSAEYEGGANQVLIATVNEFGTDDGRIPERSYLRSTVDENKSKYAALITKLLGHVVDGKLTAEVAFDRLGLTVEADVKRKIVTLIDPPNADATVQLKKSSNPLIDTGQLRQSIIYEIRKGGK